MCFFLNRLGVLAIFCIVSPIIGTICLAAIIFDGFPVFFWQIRAGKDKKPFWMLKFRTMKLGAEGEKNKIISLNEADGPVFKIKNDPRFTRFGRWLSWSGLDEIPQLLNIWRGEMALIGPRPLPVNEARKVPAKYASRFAVLPGITSTWVINGSHKLSFDEWMRMDCNYVKCKSFGLDVIILIKSAILIVHLFIGLTSRMFSFGHKI